MTRPGRTTQHSGGIVFWMLLILGFSVFTPCVLWPEWRDYQLLEDAQIQARQHLDSLLDMVDQEKRLLLAMQTDPGVVARIAQRDLRFVRSGERSVSVDISSINVKQDFYHEPVFDEKVRASDSIFIPSLLTQMGQMCPDLDYDQLFGSEETRMILIIMSISLIALSFILFGRRVMFVAK